MLHKEFVVSFPLLLLQSRKQLVLSSLQCKTPIKGNYHDQAFSDYSPGLLNCSSLRIKPSLYTFQMQTPEAPTSQATRIHLRPIQ